MYYVGHCGRYRHDERTEAMIALRSASRFYWAHRTSCIGRPARHLSSAAIKSSAYDEKNKALDTEILQPQYYVPKKERGADRSAYDLCHLVGEERRLARIKRTCPTRELYFLHAEWERHKSTYRKFRHMANLFRSAPFQRLVFPDLFCITTIAGGLTYYNEIVVCAGQNLVSLSMSPSAFAGATTAIGLLAGFRLNSSVGRINEGRKAWSEVSTTTRDLARQAMMWMKSDPTAQTRMLRLCQAYPIALIFALNDKGCHHNMKRKSRVGEAPFEERVFAEFRAELHDVYHSIEDDKGDVLKKDFERLCRVKRKGGNIPLEVITCMSETIAATGSKVDSVYTRELDVQIQRLGKAFGSGERIVKTPIPTGFTRHSSRLLFIWSNSLPFALYPLLGPFGTLPASLLTAFSVLGIEDISVQLEEPFDILPLRQYSDSMYDAIAAIEKNYTPYSATNE